MLLKRAASLAALAPGTYFEDYANNKVYLADEPTGHVIEQAYVTGGLSAQGSNGQHLSDDVIIDGIKFQHFANPAQSGVLDSFNHGYGTGWFVTNTTVTWSHGAGFELMSGSVENSVIDFNGEECGNLTGIGSRLTHSSCSGNNWAGYDGQWEGGGFKSAQAYGLEVSYSTFVNNNGVGIWCDISCYAVHIHHNTVIGNAGTGIQLEISAGGLIEDNTVINSSPPQPANATYSGASILISESAHVEVRRNTVTTNGPGIGLRQQKRSDTCTNPNFTTPDTYPNGEPVCPTTIISSGSHTLSDVYVHDNVVTSNANPTGGSAVIAGLSQDVGVDALFTSQGIRYDRNNYCLPSDGNWFTWNNAEINWSAWQAARNDTSGIFRIKGGGC